MVDVLKQLGAVSRGVRSETIDGEASSVQTLEQTYPSPIADVWDAVTSPERIARWFMPVSGELQLGGRYQLEGNAGGTVLECSPPEGESASYRVTWEFGGGVTWLTVRLRASGEGTLLELEHVARDADVPAEMGETFGPGATGVGWDGGLLGLALHLHEPASAMTPEEGAAWGVTDEGKAFYRGSADAWGEASIANGTDAEAAQRQADATYGFYTGDMGAGGYSA
ncbi:SRPBCC domain-containing protein [Agrococcus sp. Marseille-P2731]|uniref:SRPBCC domain-containing protein n=1 Tax=Agrococcus sp. Marseille-P2731 TaxID=1841862 RepID=UPI0009310082|nr:SRPBCC domain-containing protein [Agrococcus sp. Marseille-P2731]